MILQFKQKCLKRPLELFETIAQF